LLFQKQKDNKGNGINMTLGWHISENANETFYFKEGGGAGFHSEMRIYPKHKIGSIAMTNSIGFNVKKYLNETDIVFFRKESGE